MDEWFVVEPPVWEEHFPGARNWLAVVEQDPDAPGGFARTWCERGKGRFRYNAVGLMEGDLIEFGADRVYTTGNRRRTRWYGEVVEVTETTLRCRHYETVQEMFEAVYDRDVRTRTAEKPAARR